MPSSIAHGAMAVILSPLLHGHRIKRDVIISTALAAALLDIDALGRPFGRGDIEILGGHRAATHSIWTAMLLGGIVYWIYRPREGDPSKGLLALFVLLTVSSHGVLDAFSTYGEGVAFFAPVSMQRWKAPWLIFSGIIPEILLIWLPALLVYLGWLRSRTVRELPWRNTS